MPIEKVLKDKPPGTPIRFHPFLPLTLFAVTADLFATFVSELHYAGVGSDFE